MLDKNTPCDIHVVSHTHWDREWRYALQSSKNKLVGCMDKVLDTLENDPEYKHFMCDGQTVMVLDYLDYRPENRSRVQKLAQQGKLVLGPWYSLIDEFNSGGEAIIRNLLWGHITSEDLGGGQQIGYCPASFGHISQLPQILSGFGFDTALFSRGLTSNEMPDMEYIWEGSDGTRVLGAHMLEAHTKSNFTFFVYRPAINGINTEQGPTLDHMHGIPFHVNDAATAHWAFYHELAPQYSVNGQAAARGALKLKEEMLKRCTVPVVLYLDGVDQMEANPLVTEIIAEVNQRLDTGDTLRHSTLTQYFDAVKKALVDKKGVKVLQGECCYPFKVRGGNGYYGAVNSARMYQHLENERCEVLLQSWAEPMATLAHWQGWQYPAQPLRAAWRDLFANHTHDCIGGCAADQVHDNTMYRYTQIAETAGDVLERSLAHLSLQVDLSDIRDQEIPVIIYNPLPFARDEVLTIALDFPADQFVDDFTMTDQGREIPFQTTTRIRETWKLLLKWGDVSQGVPLQRMFVTFQAENIPPMGYKTIKVRYEFGPEPGGHVYKHKLTRKYPATIAHSMNIMENEHLKVEFNPNGSFNLTDKATNTVYRDQNHFTHTPDVGDVWSPISLGRELGITSSQNTTARIQLLRDGCMEAAYRVDVDLLVPESSDRSLKHKPADRLITLRLSSEVILRKGARRVDIVTTFDNNARDHILRAVFPTDLDVEYSYAAGQFDVLKRPVVREHRPDWVEPWPINHSNMGFVDACDGRKGLAVLNEGITAYQIEDEPRRPVTLTLCRATISPVSITPDEQGAQCLRPHLTRYALYPHKGDWREGGVFPQARAHNVGLRSVQTGKHDGQLPQSYSFVKIDPTDLVLSACKPAEDGAGVILRFWNPTDEDINATITFYKDIKRAALTDFKEQSLEDLKPQADTVQVQAAYKKIITLRVELD